MITNLANQGSIRTMDLGGKIDPRNSSESFDNVFQKQQLQGNEKNELRTNFAKPEPAPVKKDIDRAVPEKGNAEKAAKTNASDTRTAQRSERDEAGPVKDSGRGEEVGEKSNEREAKIRQNVMLDFMDSMESEFGIPPTRMVEAMANLSDQALEASPEDTASLVIAQLDLSEDEKPQAYAMYMGMLAQIAQLQQPKSQPAMVAETAVAAAAVPALMSHQQRRALLNKGLDQMNNQFFMQGPAALKPQSAVENMMGKQPTVPNSGLDESVVRDQVSIGNGSLNRTLSPQFDSQSKLPNMQADKMTAPREIPESALDMKGLGLENIDPNSSEAKELTKKLAALAAATAALSADMKADPVTAQALKAENSMNQLGLSDAMTSMKSEILSGDRESDDMGGSGHEGTSGNPFMVSSGQGDLSRAKPTGTEQQSFGALMAGAGAMGANAAADANDNKASIQQLMNQANFMIKKGGGEAKVQLNPEGLGEISMKVSVNEGKVGIEMSAETKEAKKLIESSLGELKSSLGAHRLTMEQVKVDVGNQTSSENKNSDSQSQQRQMDARQDQSKGQAREFWNQFNDGRNERRASFADGPGIRAYGGSRKVEALTPDSTSTASVKRYEGSGKGRGLDLVV